MEPGDTIGKYRLVSRLGRGGMGEVWLATASGYGGFTKTVVLKTLLPELGSDPLFVEMLTNEARICARLSHPNLIEVFDFTEHDGIYLLAMEHVTGRPLSHIMKAAHRRNWEIPAWFALRVVWESCRGLECAHEQGIIHCDLSPSNVMVTFTGVTKILDFGVAHSSARGAKADRLKGKFPYMAPERIKSLTTDRRADVYSLGVLLYLLITGRLPFSATSDAELLRKIVKQPPPPPSSICPVAPEIEQVIMRAMQRDPAARHQTISELLVDLTRCLEGHLGAFGQHDVADLVGGLFEVADSLAVPQLPRLPPLARGGIGDDDATDPPRLAGNTADDIESIDVVFESSVLEVQTEERVAARPRIAGAFVGARGSSEMEPLAKPLATVFALTGDAHESRTSVQSLFGDRPSLSFGATVFDRPSLDLPDPPAEVALGSDPGDRTEQLRSKLRDPAPAGDASRPASSRGVFGGYGSPRPAEPSEWPWPTSRTKSE
jgi:hypothetical protein